MDWVDVASGTERLLMVFSAKESIFKALYPIEGVWLGFDDAELTWQAGRGVFAARVLKDAGRGLPAGLELEVSCTVGATWVLTTTYVPANQDMARR
jgi:4'-phosphopantetheinyl transferase EntD